MDRIKNASPSPSLDFNPVDLANPVNLSKNSMELQIWQRFVGGSF